MPRMEGVFSDGPDKGRPWQVYADPASPTGYTRKRWDPYAPDHVEYFDPYNYAAAAEDERQQQARDAAAAAEQSRLDAIRRDFLGRDAAATNSQNRYRDTLFTEDTRRFDVQQQQTARTERNRVQQAKDALKEQRRQYDLTYGQRQTEIGNQDMRSREQNLLTYLQAIGRLHLPYAELQALSQRAVAGIVPGGTASGGGAGTASLTPDQWAAMAQGTTRDWEVGQVGQGNPLRG